MAKSDTATKLDFEPGQKIAQAVLIPVSYCEVDEVVSDNLNEGSTRGDGALGSTGDR